MPHATSATAAVAAAIRAERLVVGVMTAPL
jgi:hypothetical protein